MTTEDSNEVAKQDRLTANLAKIEGLSQRMIAAMGQRKQADQALYGPDQAVYMKAAAAYVAEMMQNPAKIIEHQASYWAKSLQHYVDAQKALASGAFMAPADPTLEGDGTEIALQIVAPGMIGAGEILDVAAVLERDQRAAMGAAVFEAMQRAIFAAHDDHRHFAHEGGAVIALVFDIDIQAQEMPGGTLENAPLFRAQYFRILVQPERNPADASGPVTFGRVIGDHRAIVHACLPGG